MDANLSIDEAPPSLYKVREAVAEVKGEKAECACNIRVELLKASDEAMTHELHAILTAVWQCGSILTGW